MAGETDRLIQFCREASLLYDPREYDVVVASGEQVTSGLLAITLQGMGLNARSYMGWQLPVRTSAAHSARSEEHTSELQSLMRRSYAVFCLKKKTHRIHQYKIN